MLLHRDQGEDERLLLDRVGMLRSAERMLLRRDDGQGNQLLRDRFGLLQPGKRMLLRREKQCSGENLLRVPEVNGIVESIEPFGFSRRPGGFFFSAAPGFSPA